jgi:hypothetical protein
MFYTFGYRVHMVDSGLKPKCKKCGHEFSGQGELSGLSKDSASCAKGKLAPFKWFFAVFLKDPVDLSQDGTGSFGDPSESA